MSDEWSPGGGTCHSSLVTHHCVHYALVSVRQKLLGSKRYVILRSLFGISNLLDELIEMLGCVHEVDLVGIHNQQRRLVVPVKVMRVRLAELLQILWRDRFFVSPPALLDAPEECIKVSLQVDDQLRLRHRFVEEVVEPVVDHQLRVLERQVREDLALGKAVVGD